MIVDLAAPTLGSCAVTEGCITCGDVAVALTVLRIVGQDGECQDALCQDALCQDESGRTETVAVELVGAVTAGDVLLVHAGVALERLSDDVGRGEHDALRG